jgi:isochorismate pyruvate lyase
MTESVAETGVKLPQNCATMIDVRAGVDDVDRRLVDLLALRFGYMDAAARIKDSRAAVRDEARKAEVITNVRTAAAAAGLPEDVLAQLWDHLVEASITYEFDKFDRRTTSRPPHPRPKSKNPA